MSSNTWMLAYIADFSYTKHDSNIGYHLGDGYWVLGDGGCVPINAEEHKWISSPFSGVSTKVFPRPEGEG